jgi:hypothetical protein
MPAAQVAVTEGSGKNVATYDISEGTTKQLQRIVLNNSSGVEVDFTATSPVTGSGSAGTPATGVVTVQGITGGTPQPVTSLSYAVATVCTSGTTAYVATDVVGGAKDFGVLGPNASSIMITTVQLMINLSSVTSGMTSFTLHLFNVTPPSAIADSSPFTLASGDRASYLGSVLIGTPVDLGDTLYVEVNGVNKQVKLAGTKLFGYLTTNGAYTPTAVDYTVTIHTMAV